jgi:hypothetical protein
VNIAIFRRMEPVHLRRMMAFASVSSIASIGV